MASNRAPVHDFTPAWLKIPTQPSTKHPVEGTRNIDSSMQGQQNESEFSDKGTQLQRQRSFENYNEESQLSRDKYRHHSVDSYHESYYSGYYGEYYDYPVYPMSTISRGEGHNSKYQHPHARESQQAYPVFTSPFNQSFNDMMPHYMTNKESNANEGLQNSKNRSTGAGNFQDDEFPSLRGDNKKTESSASKSVGSVWEKPNNKVYSRSTPSPEAKHLTPNQEESSKSNMSIYKAAIPNKGLSARKPSEVCNESDLKDKNSNKITNGFQKENVIGTKYEDTAVNRDNLDMNNPDKFVLSSSLEAEQRLLREMGWNEADEEEYEITEDDMKEFLNLSKQTKDQRNGITRNLPVRWGPFKDADTLFPVECEALSDTSGDSDLDSD